MKMTLFYESRRFTRWRRLSPIERNRKPPYHRVMIFSESSCVRDVLMFFQSRGMMPTTLIRKHLRCYSGTILKLQLKSGADWLACAAWTGGVTRRASSGMSRSELAGPGECPGRIQTRISWDFITFPSGSLSCCARATRIGTGF